MCVRVCVCVCVCVCCHGDVGNDLYIDIYPSASN